MTSNRNTFLFVLTLLAFLTFKLSAQESGEIGPIDLSDPSNLTDGSYIISTSGTYHFTGTYRGTPTADIDGTRNAVINVEANAGDVTILLDNTTILLSGEYQCPLSVRNATGEVTVQLKGINTLSTIHNNGASPALWAPETNGATIIIMNNPNDVNIGSLTTQGARNWPGIGIERRKGSGSAIKIESGKIEAKGGDQAAGIGASSGSGGYEEGTLIITGGTVTANGGKSGAGIGGGDGGNGGTVTITGGTVFAKGGLTGAGIGGGKNSSGGTVTITGGNVTALGNWHSAGIGGCLNGSGGTVTITGGNVIAQGSQTAAGIGGAGRGSGAIVTISGGIVIAQGGNQSANGIGKGSLSGTVGSFSTGIGGNAIIFAQNIQDQMNREYWSGLIFEGNVGRIYGNNSYTLTQNIEIPSDKTLEIESEKILIIDSEITLTNNGTILNQGTILNYGEIVGNDPVEFTHLTDNMITLSVSDFLYTGEMQKPTIAVQDGGTVLTVDKDYSISYSGDCIHAGNYTITITGQGNYSGTLIKNFTIRQATNGWTTDLEMQDRIFGTISAPTATAKFGTPTFSYARSQDGEYKENVLLTAGTWWVKAAVNGTEDYTALESRISFTVYKVLPLYVIPTNLSAIYGQTLADVALPAGWTWQADVTTPVGNVGTSTFQATYTPDDTENYQVVENVDISVVVQPKSLTAEMIQLSEDVFIDDGQHSQPTIAVKDGETVLIEDTDYTVTWPEGGFSAAGRYAVTITGQGNYQGEQTVWITKINIKTVTGEEELSALSDGYMLEIKSGGHAILKQGGITFESVTIEEGGQLTPDYTDLNAVPATVKSLIFKPTLENKWKAVGMLSVYTLLNSQEQEMNVSDKDAETGIWFAGLKNEAPEIEVKAQYENAGLWAANNGDSYVFKTNNSVVLQKAKEPTAPENGLQMCVNPNTFDITLTQSAYVLNETGTVFELVENPTIQAFQSFVLADTNTTATLRSIGASNSNVTVNEFIVKAGYYLTTDRGVIVVHTAEPMELYVVAVSGVMVYRGKVTDGQRIEVPTGFYVVNGQMVRVK